MTTNIFVTEELECKIANFEITCTIGGDDGLLPELIPPEVMPENLTVPQDIPKFPRKGDVYCFAWVMYEVITERQPEKYNLKKARQDLKGRTKKEMPEECDFVTLILQSLNKVLQKTKSIKFYF